MPQPGAARAPPPSSPARRGKRRMTSAQPRTAIDWLDAGVDEVSDGIGCHQLAVDRLWDIVVAVSAAIFELDLQDMAGRFVADGIDRRRFNRLPPHPRKDTRLREKFLTPW